MYLNGSVVSKVIHIKKGGIDCLYSGQVVRYNDGLYTIMYKDGMEEMLSKAELDEIMVVIATQHQPLPPLPLKLASRNNVPTRCFNPFNNTAPQGT